MSAAETILAQIRRHGLTAVDKAEIATAQLGCAICGRTEPGRKGWVVDHDRSCCAGDQSCLDCRRAILCQWCNNALGYAFDSPMTLRRMADYIELGTRMHPSQVWNQDRLNDQLADLSTESVDRIGVGSPTNVTDETNEESTYPPLKSFRSVPRTRIPRVTLLAPTAALRASLIRQEPADV